MPRRLLIRYWTREDDAELESLLRFGNSLTEIAVKLKRLGQQSRAAFASYSPPRRPSERDAKRRATKSHRYRSQNICRTDEHGIRPRVRSFAP